MNTPSKDFIKPNRCYESMTRIKVGDYTVRVWMTETYLFNGPHPFIISALKTGALKALGKKLPAVHAIAKILDALNNVAAYEILDKNGNGCIVYPDWK